MNGSLLTDDFSWLHRSNNDRPTSQFTTVMFPWNQPLLYEKCDASWDYWFFVNFIKLNFCIVYTNFKIFFCIQIAYCTGMLTNLVAFSHARPGYCIYFKSCFLRAFRRLAYFVFLTFNSFACFLTYTKLSIADCDFLKWNFHFKTLSKSYSLFFFNQLDYCNSFLNMPTILKTEAPVTRIIQIIKLLLNYKRSDLYKLGYSEFLLYLRFTTWRAAHPHTRFLSFV